MLESLYDAGFGKAEFYNIDLLRPSQEEIVRHLTEYHPDIICISAVVSTSYAFVKEMSAGIKGGLQDVPIILGGNMAASHEVLLAKCSVDICVFGEGEEIIVDLCRHWQKFHAIKDNEALRQIPGIAFRSGEEAGKIVFTGKRGPLAPQKIKQPNYDLLDGYYLRDIAERLAVVDSSYVDPNKKRDGSKIAYVELAKGCVNRCTFCHRWTKGYRVLPLEYVVSHTKKLVNNHDVGYLCFGEENFGSNMSYTKEFIQEVDKLDCLWHVAGMRVTSLTLDMAEMMKKAGCVAIYFGMESGSDKMLNIMEKNATVDDNLLALEILAKVKIYTNIALVLGMPGESNQTIRETISFLKRAKEILGVKYLRMSMTYAQALPGTPLYEYARQQGVIGSTIDKQEEYLLKVSDTNASSTSHFLNMTEEKMIDVLFWKRLIDREVNGSYAITQSKRVNSTILLLEKVLGRKIVESIIRFVAGYAHYRSVWTTVKKYFQDDRSTPVKNQSLRLTVQELAGAEKMVQINPTGS